MITTRNCHQCNKPFGSSDQDARFCSYACSNKHNANERVANGRVKPAILALLTTGVRLHKHEISERLHCDKRTAERALIMLRERKEISICGWHLKHSNATAIYRLGTFPEPRRPAPKPAVVRKRKQRKSAEYVEKENAMRRARRSLEKVVRIGLWGL